MAPFTSNVWRASVLVIALLMQGHGLLASQSDCRPIAINNDQEMCMYMYECNASELQMFNCSKNLGPSYTPSLVGSQSFCCPGYFKTDAESGVCQICRDDKFMPRLNNCCDCISCKDCDAVVNDTKKKRCTRKSNTVCWIQTDPTPSPGLTCPIEGLPTTTVPAGIEPTGTNHSNNSSNDPVERKSNRKYTNDFIVLLVFCIIFAAVVVFVFCLCFYLIWLGANADQVDGRNTPWKEALTPLAQKLHSNWMRKGPPRDRAVDRAVDPAVDPAENPAEDPAVDPSVDPPMDPPVDPPVVPCVDPPRGLAGYNDRENDGQDEPNAGFPLMPSGR